MMTIYTDGSCSNNPGPGGFGVIIVENGKVIHAYRESRNNTTNNRMEMAAILYALENYGSFSPIVYSDSAYCVNSFTKWISGWKANGWTRTRGKKLENLDLIKRYDELISQGKKIDLKKIKGHVGLLYNELADQLATGKITPEEVMKEYG